MRTTLLQALFSIAQKVAICAALLTVGACDSPQIKPPAVVGLFGFDGYEPFFWAETKGYFAENTVHLVETPVDLGLLQAFRGATVNAQALTLSRALQWEQEEVDAVVVFPIVSSNGLDRIVARPGINSILDLKGKVVGIEFGTVSEYLLVRALAEAGISASDVTFVGTSNDVLARYLQAGEVDAISAFGSEVEALGSDYRVLKTSADYPGEILDVLVVRQDYLNDNAEQVADLIYGYLKSVQDFDTLTALGGPEADLPRGVVADNKKVSDIREVEFFSAQKAAALMLDDAQGLRQLIEKRRSIVRERFGAGIRPLNISPAPFLLALERLEGEAQ